MVRRVHTQLLVGFAISALMATACGGGVEGTARVEDQIGDVERSLNFHGMRPSSIPSAVDLSGVVLTAHGGWLSIDFQLKDSVPETAIGNDPEKGPAWFVRFWRDRDTATQEYVVGITYAAPSKQEKADAKFSVIVCPGTKLCKTEIKDAKVSVERNLLSVAIPLSRIERLSKHFQWLAGTYWNNVLDREFAWGDDAPDQPQSADTRGVRPEHRADFPGLAA
jgi:hypothetical protein